MNDDGWGPNGEYPEWAYEPVDYCDRCGAPIAADAGGTITANIDGVGEQWWDLCAECIDSFTAWRLSRDGQADELVGDELALTRENGEPNEQ